ncbi:MAG: 4Fe-4S binding protein [Deltaproteobacteria bacterium]|nr:4Fe-4S binding protein [Deltaproteobacteria bacterium]
MKITLGAVVKGGTSLNYKTGSWRDQRPVLNIELCKACGVCESVCPDGAVHLVNEAYRIDYDYCKGCGLCAYECPADAIQMVAEEK